RPGCARGPGRRRCPCSRHRFRLEAASLGVAADRPTISGADRQPSAMARRCEPCALGVATTSPATDRYLPVPPVITNEKLLALKSSGPDATSVPPLSW